MIADRPPVALRQRDQKGREFFHRGFAGQHHEMILHRRNLTQGGVQQPFMRAVVSVEIVERMAGVGDYLRRLDRFAIAVMQRAVGKADDVARQAKGDDLPPPVAQHAAQTKDTRGDLIDMMGDIAFAK